MFLLPFWCLLSSFCEFLVVIVEHCPNNKIRLKNVAKACLVTKRVRRGCRKRYNLFGDYRFGAADGPTDLCGSRNSAASNFYWNPGTNRERPFRNRAFGVVGRRRHGKKKKTILTNFRRYKYHPARTPMRRSTCRARRGAVSRRSRPAAAAAAAAPTEKHRAAAVAR